MIDYSKVLKILCKEPRFSGSKRNKEIRHYLINELKNFGYYVNIQEFPFTGWKLIKLPQVRFIKPISQKIQILPVVWSPSIKENKIAGQIRQVKDIKTFEAYPWERFAVIDKKGHTLCYFITRKDFVWAQPLNNSKVKTPYIIIDTKACQIIHQFIQERKPISVCASLECQKIKGLKIANILASFNEKYEIIVAAHYDSMFNTVGAHDNASGIAALLGVAETKPSNVKFIAFDAEEWNKFGAYSYVERVKTSSQFKKTKIMINLDSVGVGDFIYLLVSPAIEDKIKKAVKKTSVAKRIKIEITAAKAFPQFDSWPFMKNGIPVIQIGTKGALPFRYFHDPKDTLKNIKTNLIKETSLLVTELINQLQDNLGGK
ncbi:MAG: M28 family peptidase [Candidatus Levyibacteriota bacterium]